MRLFSAAVAVLLGAASAAHAYTSKDFLGTWQCSGVTPMGNGLSLESGSTDHYYEDGTVRSVGRLAFKQKGVAVVGYEFKGSNTYNLSSGNKLKYQIQKASLKNVLGEEFERQYKLTEKLLQPGQVTNSEVVSLSKNQMTLESSDAPGALTVCTRV